MEPDEVFIEDLRLRNRQEYVNRMFEEEGMTDEILKKQVEINKKRNELDIHDRKQTSYQDDGVEYVQ